MYGCNLPARDAFAPGGHSVAERQAVGMICSRTMASGGEPCAAGAPSAIALASTAARRAAAALCADAGAAGPFAAPAVKRY